MIGYVSTTLVHSAVSQLHFDWVARLTRNRQSRTGSLLLSVYTVDYPVWKTSELEKATEL